MRISSRRLGEFLVDRRVLSRDVLDELLAREAAEGVHLSNLLVADQLVSEQDLMAAVANELGVPYIGLGARLLSNEGRTMATLISPSVEVRRALQDMAVGGLYDDAFSRTLHLHLLGSLGRVYGGFLLAALAALPLGLLIGRVALVRQLLDPTFQVLRPIPVTAWLPLAMILFGLGARSAFFLVFLGAFYPVLVNTIFGVRSVEPRLFEAAAMLGCQGSAQFFRVVLSARR